MIIQTSSPSASYSPARPQAAVMQPASPLDTVSVQAPPQDEPRHGSIAAGVALAAIGSGLIAAASIGLPGVPPVGPGLLNGALRFCGLLAFCGAHDQWAQGDDNRVVRGSLMCTGGVLGMLSAAGVFGHVGGLTAVAMGIGGFLTTLNGIGKLSGEKSEA
ncbi:MAG: hypothetical protein AB1758_15155 [Candidatus Eremiobacterota bacterium]